jgi:hypothetical protein
MEQHQRIVKAVLQRESEHGFTVTATITPYDRDVKSLLRMELHEKLLIGGGTLANTVDINLEEFLQNGWKLLKVTRENYDIQEIEYEHGIKT